MKKYLVIGDIHWSAYSSILRKRGQKYSLRLEKLIEALNWVEKFAVDNGCDGEIFLGDTFDRPDLGCEEITALQEVKWNSLPKTFIVGNHESNVMSLDFSSTKIFENINARIVDNPLSEDITDKVSFTYIPYITDSQLKPLSSYLPGDKKKVVFAHEDIAGIQYGKYTSTSGFSISEIEENCNLFIDGHLHNGCKVGKNIILLGNLTGQNFTENSFEFNHVVGILSVDDDGSIGLETTEVEPAINFYKLRIEKKKDLNQLNKIKNNAVLSITCVSSLVKDLDDMIRDNEKIIEHKTVIIFEGEHFSTEESVDFIVDDHMKQFIDFIQSKMDPSPTLSEEISKLMGGN